MIWVNIDELVPHPMRVVKNPDSNDADIMKDIMEHGITTPLLVDLTDGRIICGHRRWAVAKLLGLEQVPVTIISDSYDHLAIEQEIIKNNLSTRPGPNSGSATRDSEQAS
jgi:ParB-like chromosome segregation protein Spo0J